jgi:hypothetical protein
MEITFDDSSGHTISEFNLTYATPSTVVMVDTADVDTEEGIQVDTALQANPHTKDGYPAEGYMKSHEWVVVGVHSDSSKDVRLIQGTVTLTLAHPWFIYRDIKNHAYKPIRTDELLKEILKDSSRGWKFPELIDDNFEKTDDEGREPRYRIQKTDLDFIQENLLPDASIGFDTAYFWIDYWGDPHMKSFTSMIKVPPKILFGPKQDDPMSDLEVSSLEKYIEDFGIAIDGYYVTLDRTISAYSPKKIDEFRKEIYPNFVIEDVNMNYQFVMGKRDPGTKMPGENGGYFPMLQPVKDRIQGTDIKIGKNNLVDDSISEMFADDQILNECFSMTITSTFTGQYGLPGMTAQVYIPKVTYEDEETGEEMRVDHWAEGKWLISETEHFIKEDESPHKVYTRTTLIRPTFLINNPDKSGLTTHDIMWKIEG